MKITAWLMSAALMAQPPAQQTRATFSTTANIVVVNVTVLSRDGKPVENLGVNDFILTENGKPQSLQTCELEKLESSPLPGLTVGPASAASGTALKAVTKPEADAVQDKRLIVMLFDMSSMQPAEQIRATKAATQFLSTKMTASDLVSVMTFSSTLRTLVEFTDDRDTLISAIQKMQIGEGSELADLADIGADAEDQSGLFVADDTEFNIFNTDRKLAALQEAARRLRSYPQKKALVYLSSGLQRTGVDNQSQLQSTVNTAIRANVAFYPIDVRGLVATAPGGGAEQGGAGGSRLFSGAGQASMRSSFHNEQETLDTLAAETGGKALLDSNDLSVGMTQVQQDIRSYYILTYASMNAAEDGRYRRIQVKLAPKHADLKAKLEYRPGYYAPTTFGKTSEADREVQLSEAMASENPLTDLPMAVEVDYFRLERNKYFVPVSVRIPGSALAFRKKGARAATELDFVAQVRDKRGQPMFTVRDTIPLKLGADAAGQVAQRQIAYDTGGVLPPGSYKLRFVARENGEGKVGTFETPFTIPDLGSGKELRMSSVVLSNQIQTLSGAAGVKNDKKLVAMNPLVSADGQKIVPNVTRVFRPNQTLRAYLEVYDPASPSEGGQGMGPMASVTASVAVYQGDQKVMESQPVRRMRTDAKRTTVAPVLVEAPMASLQPGDYECQVNVIDQVGRKFAFPRTKIVVMPALGR